MNEPQKVDGETREFAQQIADQVESFLIALQAIAREGDVGRAISLLLLEISQVLLAGARLGAQRDFEPRAEYQPDVGPEPDIDEMRLRLAEMLGSIDTYGLVFDPYVPELKAYGLRHTPLDEALDGADLALIVTAHPGIDHDHIASMVATVDFRGVTRRERAAARPPATELPAPRAQQTEPTEVAA